MIPRLRNVALDCNALDAMVAFWSEVPSFEVPARPRWWVLEDPEGNHFCIGRMAG